MIPKTMIPMTHKEIQPQKRQKCCRFWTWHNVALSIALHGVISTLLLPLTIRGSIGGQYGMFKTGGYDQCGRKDGLLSLTDMSLAHEIFLISLLFLAHSLGLFTVIKKSILGMVGNLMFLSMELSLSICWLGSVYCGAIKSHVMSQDSLHQYCSVSLAIQFISLLILMMFICEGGVRSKQS